MNLQSILLLVFLAVIFIFAIRRIIRDARGGGCSFENCYCPD